MSERVGAPIGRLARLRPAPRVLITGGCGFIGRHLARALVCRGHRVVLLDDLSGADAAAPIEAALRPAIRVVVGSVTDAACVRRAAAGCTAVVHLAGLVGMDRVVVERERTFQVSAQGTATVLRVTGHLPVLLASSSCVYGHGGADPCREDEPIPRARALAFDAGAPGYATGKWELERLAHHAAAAGRAVLVVRPFNIVGPGQSDHHGMVLPRFLRAALAGAPLTIYGDGDQTRAFSCVATAAEVLATAIERSSCWPTGDAVVNLGAPAASSVLTLARTVLEETGSRSPVVHRPYQRRYPGHHDVMVRRPDQRRAERVFGDVAWPDLRDVVRAALDQRLRGHAAAARAARPEVGA